MFSQCPDTRPAPTKFYAVAGRLLFIDAPDDRAAGLVGRLFRDWHLTPAAPPPGAGPDATVAISRAAPPPVPRGLDSFQISDGGRCHTDGREYHLDIGGSRVLFGGGGAHVRVWLCEGAGGAPGMLAQVVFNAFSAAMRRCGLFELHSAGVVGPKTGGAALVVGPSGSGKSTLTMQLAAAGWGYLTDDVLLLEEVAGRAEARPLRRVFAATEAAVAAAGLPGHAGGALRPANSKLRFAPQTFFPGAFVESCLPEALIFPRVTHERESRVAEVSRPEALSRLLRTCPWACYDRTTAAAYLRALSLLARQCRAFELRAGTDLLADPQAAAGLLASRVVN